VEAHIFDTVKGATTWGSGRHRGALLRGSGGHPAPGLHGRTLVRTPEGRPAQRSLGGAGFPRACYAADISGHVVLHTLYERALGAGVRIYPEWHLVELLVEEGALAGLLVYNVATGRLEVVRCRAALLATGGYGRIFARPPMATPTPGTARPSLTGRGRCWPIWSSSNSTPPPCTAATS